MCILCPCRSLNILSNDNIMAEYRFPSDDTVRQLLEVLLCNENVQRKKYEGKEELKWRYEGCKGKGERGKG